MADYSVWKSSVSALVGNPVKPGAVGKSSVSVLYYKPPDAVASVAISGFVGPVVASAFPGDSEASVVASLFPTARASAILVSRYAIAKAGLMFGPVLAEAKRISTACAKSSLFIKAAATAKTEGDMWGSLGLPHPTISGYSVRADRGLVRTDMESGYVRQRRKYKDAFREVTLTVELARSQLNIFEEFVNSRGVGWTTMKLLTEDTATTKAEPHLVRISSTYTVTAGPTSLTVNFKADIARW